jgi:hypothetical protein
MNRKSIILVGALSLALMNLANAVNYVYVTGSTAARGQFFSTMNDLNVVFDAAPVVISQGNATASKGSYMNFTGHLVGDPAGVTTTVKCHWSGSEAGIQDLVSGTETFLDDAAGNNSSSTPPGPFVSSPVDIAMADNDKAYSKNPNAAITGQFCGVIPFKWVKQKGSVAGLVNVNDAQLRTLFTGGSPVSLLTGNSADTTWVYITGRDSGSGTRVNTFGVSGYGIGSAPFQLQVSANGSMVDQGSGIYLGDYGYASGGTVATQMGYDLAQATSQDVYTGTGAHFSVIAYLGYGDAGTAVANGGMELTYNGVGESTAAIREGQYGFWGNEFIYRKNVVSSQALSVYNKLSPAATGINAHADNLGLIDLRTMNATRNGPTSDPIHN